MMTHKAISLDVVAMHMALIKSFLENTLYDESNKAQTQKSERQKAAAIFNAGDDSDSGNSVFADGYNEEEQRKEFELIS